MDEEFGFDEYGHYEDDLQEFSDREAWEDAQADAYDAWNAEDYTEDDLG